MRQYDRDHLRQRCVQRGIVLSDTQLDRLMYYVDLLLQWRRHVNLTGLRQTEQVIDVLVVESLDFLQHQVLPRSGRVLDLGTGAGVPGVPLAICAPDLQVTLLDRSEKKITFLRHLLPRLRMQNCQACCMSAEALRRCLRPEQRFDAVVARGVGEMGVVQTLAAPLLRPGGVLLLRKPAGAAEVREAAARLDTTCWAEVRIIPVSGAAPAGWTLVAVWRAPEQPA